MKTPLKLDDRRRQPATGLHCGPRPASQTARLHWGGLAGNRTICIFATSHSFYDTPRMAAQRRPFGWAECLVLADQRRPICLLLMPVFASRPAPRARETPTASHPAYEREHPLRGESAAAT
jgi:hypothetical protein